MTWAFRALSTRVRTTASTRPRIASAASVSRVRVFKSAREVRDLPAVELRHSGMQERRRLTRDLKLRF
jgi:hypothetical protein